MKRKVQNRKRPISSVESLSSWQEKKRDYLLNLHMSQSTCFGTWIETGVDFYGWQWVPSVWVACVGECFHNFFGRQLLLSKSAYLCTLYASLYPSDGVRIMQWTHALGSRGYIILGQLGEKCFVELWSTLTLADSTFTPPPLPQITQQICQY